MRAFWTWIPSLFAAEEIPAAMITYVALFMFIQTDTPPAVALGYCGCLFIPWVLKSFVRERVRRMGHFHRVIQWIELGMVLTMGGIALTFPRYTRLSEWLFVGLFILSVLTAWHELAARMYYERMLYPQQQREYNGLKIFCAQMATVCTYGLLILMVGGFQVIYRSIPRAWAMGCYLCAGVMLVFALYHMAVLRRPHVGDAYRPSTGLYAIRAEMRVIDRIRHKRHWLLAVTMLGVLLLPQSLMFYSRVLFLLAPVGQGGLGCTIQEVALAQGAVGVIAFTVGIFLGRQLMLWLDVSRLLWWMAIPLGLSPAIYLMMTIEPPSSLGVLCVATFQAQFSFGFGLNICMHFVHYISGERYRNTINYLYVPLVAIMMVVPMAASGWLIDVLGFHTFFAIDASTALLAWIYLFIYRHETIRLGSDPVLR